jgi:hypothetical protein
MFTVDGLVVFAADRQEALDNRGIVGAARQPGVGTMRRSRPSSGPLPASDSASDPTIPSRCSGSLTGMISTVRFGLITVPSMKCVRDRPRRLVRCSNRNHEATRQIRALSSRLFIGGHYDQSLVSRPANTTACASASNAPFGIRQPPNAAAKRLDRRLRGVKALAPWCSPNVPHRPQVPEPGMVAGTELVDESRRIHHELLTRRAVVNHKSAIRRSGLDVVPWHGRGKDRTQPQHRESLRGSRICALLAPTRGLANLGLRRGRGILRKQTRWRKPSRYRRRFGGCGHLWTGSRIRTLRRGGR